tara:strand:+ start:464 stop:610 length:147 start_codon:yes stop_codon:yes gene_type:complete
MVSTDAGHASIATNIDLYGHAIPSESLKNNQAFEEKINKTIKNLDRVP